MSYDHDADDDDGAVVVAVVVVVVVAAADDDDEDAITAHCFSFCRYSAVNPMTSK